MLHAMARGTDRARWSALLLVLIGAGLLLGGLSQHGPYLVTGRLEVAVLDRAGKAAERLPETPARALDAHVRRLREPLLQEEAYRRVGSRRDLYRIEVAGGPGPRSITITTSGPAPDDCAELTNQLGQVYCEQRARVKEAELRKALAALVVRQRSLGSRVVDAEVVLAVRRKYSDPSAAPTTPQTAVVPVTLARRIAALQQKLAAEPQWIEQSHMAPNPAFARAEAKVEELRQQRAALLEDYRETSPEVREVEGRVREAEERLTKIPTTLFTFTREPNPTRRALRAEVAALRGKRPAAAPAPRLIEDAVEAPLPVNPEQLAPLTTRRDTLRRRAASLRKQHEELLASLANPPWTIRIVEHAVPPRVPEEHPYRRPFLLAGSIALLLGLLHGTVGLRRSAGHAPQPELSRIEDDHFPVRQDTLSLAERVSRYRAGLDAGETAPLMDCATTTVTPCVPSSDPASSATPPVDATRTPHPLRSQPDPVPGAVQGTAEPPAPADNVPAIQQPASGPTGDARETRGAQDPAITTRALQGQPEPPPGAAPVIPSGRHTNPARPARTTQSSPGRRSGNSRRHSR